MDSELQQASVKVRSMSSSLPGSGFVNTLRETSDLINHLNIHNLDEDVNKFITFLSVFSDGLLNSYSVYRKMTDSCEEDLEMLKAILAFQCAFLNERFLQALKEFDVPSEHFGSLLVKFGNVASSADQTEIRLGFQAWKFVSQFLSLFHVVVKQALIENFDSDTEAPMSDEFIRCMLLSAKRIFSECVVDTEKHLTTKSGEPIWRNKLKLAAFICRLIVGCVKQFQSVLFRTKETCQHRCIVDFISWAIEVQYAGGLFTAGTGLDADFLKEVSTSLFVATEMALSCLCQIESDPTLNVSAAANAIVSANLAPLVNCRTFASVLVNLSNRRDEKSFQSWLSDNFSAYAQIFTNLEAAFSSWKPYEITPKLSDFHVPRFLNLKIDQSKLSSAVEEFLTEITIEICRSVRCLPNSVFPYLIAPFQKVFIQKSRLFWTLHCTRRRSSHL
uniref:D-aminoacyl-tRNA deacylase n=1 Tax=Mesocestoides corti TaxID=53468 RepID=A0A5K3F4Q0_MESCO